MDQMTACTSNLIRLYFTRFLPKYLRIPQVTTSAEVTIQWLDRYGVSPALVKAESFHANGNTDPSVGKILCVLSLTAAPLSKRVSGTNGPNA